MRPSSIGNKDAADSVTMKPTPFLNNARRRVRRKAITLLWFSMLVAAPVVAADVTLSDTLELGIYTEETKGDLNGAIELYQTVLRQSESDRAVAAQAQFRLALCYDKKKDFAAATEAFETLVRDYPEQKEFVALANEYLADGAVLLPAPWVDGEELTMDIKFATGAKFGAARYRVSSGHRGDTDTWLLQSHLIAGTQTWSRTEVEARTFRPLHSRWKSDVLGKAETEFSPGSATLTLKGRPEPTKIDLEGMVYDNEEAIHLMRRLPLAEGYTSRLSIYVSLNGGIVMPIGLHVTARESVTVPAGTFDCFKVELNINQTFWYSADAHRYLVKFEAMGVIAELASIGSFTPGQPERFADSRHSFSVEMPADWYLLPHPNNAKPDRTVLLALDPDANTISIIKVDDVEKLEAAAQESPRAFAEHQIAQGKKNAPKYEVRPDSWTETQLAGQPAVSYIADVHTGPTGMQVFISVCGFVEGKAVDISCVIPPDEVEKYRPILDTVVAAYRAR